MTSLVPRPSSNSLLLAVRKASEDESLGTRLASYYSSTDLVPGVRVLLACSQLGWLLSFMTVHVIAARFHLLIKPQ